MRIIGAKVFVQSGAPSGGSTCAPDRLAGHGLRAPSLRTRERRLFKQACGVV
jgi:hypothetical protein